MTRRLLLSYLGFTLAILALLEIPLALNYGDRLQRELSGDLVRDAFAIAGYSEETVEGNESVDRVNDLAVSFCLSGLTR